MSLKFIQTQGLVEIEYSESTVQVLEQYLLASVFITPKEEVFLTKRRASVLLGTVLHILAIQVFVLKYIENENLTKVKVSLAEVCVLNSFLSFFFSSFFETVFLCSFGASPGTHSIDQAGLDLTEICLSLPPVCWD